MVAVERGAGRESLTAVVDTEAEDARVARIYESERTRLCALGTLLCGDQGVGEDLAHDVFVTALRLCRSTPGYLREPAWPWLRVAMVRLAARRGRRLAAEVRRLTLLYERPHHDPWSTETADVVAALRSLPPRMRAVAVLFYREDMATADVAAALGISPRTVENQLRQARGRMARHLGADREDGR